MKKNDKPYDSELVFEKLCERYEALYIIDLENNIGTKIKSSQDLKSIHNPDELEFEWDSVIKEFIEKLINDNFKELMTYFYNRENLQKMFKDETDKKECIHQLFSGKWNKVIFQPIEIKKGITKKVLMTVIDFSYSKSQTAKILESAQITLNKYHRLFIDAVDDTYGQIIKFNYMTGNASSISIVNDKIIEVPSQNWDTLYKQLFICVHPEDKEVVNAASSIDNLLKLKYNEKVTYTYRSNRENPYEYRWYTTTIKITSDVGDATAFTQDITDHIQERKSLLDKSEHDSMTELFNRNKLQQMIESEYKDLKTCGVLFYDINNLKPTNDKYGHEAGDRLLKNVADSIHSITGRNIHAYRYGGDEFLVIAPNAREEDMNILISLWKIRLDNLFAESEIPCSVAVGSAWTSAKDEPIEITELIRVADKKMYANKQEMKAL